MIFNSLSMGVNLLVRAVCVRQSCLPYVRFFALATSSTAMFSPAKHPPDPFKIADRANLSIGNCGGRSAVIRF
jgi:hypothetical protein